jgi:hypothetical protein
MRGTSNAGSKTDVHPPTRRGAPGLGHKKSKQEENHTDFHPSTTRAEIK